MLVAVVLLWAADTFETLWKAEQEHKNDSYRADNVPESPLSNERMHKLQSATTQLAGMQLPGSDMHDVSRSTSQTHSTTCSTQAPLT